MSAMGSMSDLTLSGEELQEVQERAAESPIIVGFVGLLGDVNGAMLSLFENMRSPGGKDRTGMKANKLTIAALSSVCLLEQQHSMISACIAPHVIPRQTCLTNHGSSHFPPSKPSL
eukprot:scaffold102246_cov15-Tisochrysis_lutea.AAC.2